MTVFKRVNISENAAQIINFLNGKAKSDKRLEEHLPNLNGINQNDIETFLRKYVNRSWDIGKVRARFYPHAEDKELAKIGAKLLAKASKELGPEEMWFYYKNFRWEVEKPIEERDEEFRGIVSKKEKALGWLVNAYIGNYMLRSSWNPGGLIPQNEPKEPDLQYFNVIDIWDADTVRAIGPQEFGWDIRDANNDGFESSERIHYLTTMTMSEISAAKKVIASKKKSDEALETLFCDGKEESSNCLVRYQGNNSKITRNAVDLLYLWQSHYGTIVEKYFGKVVECKEDEKACKAFEDEDVVNTVKAFTIYRGKLGALVRKDINEWTRLKNGKTPYTRSYKPWGKSPELFGSFGRLLGNPWAVSNGGNIHTDTLIRDYIAKRLPEFVKSPKVVGEYTKAMKLIEERWPHAEAKFKKAGIPHEEIKEIKAVLFGLRPPQKEFEAQKCKAISDNFYRHATYKGLNKSPDGADMRYPAAVNMMMIYSGLSLRGGFKTSWSGLTKSLEADAICDGNGLWRYYKGDAGENRNLVETLIIRDEDVWSHLRVRECL